MHFKGQIFPGSAIGKNGTTEPLHRGEEKRSVEDWSSARLHSLFRDAKPSNKARCSANQHMAGFRQNPRLKFAFWFCWSKDQRLFVV